MALDETAEWGTEEYLMARISDALELSNYLFIKANSEDDDIPMPEPIRRPGDPEEVEPEKPKPQFASGQEVAAFFSQMNNL